MPNKASDNECLRMKKDYSFKNVLWIVSISTTYDFLKVQRNFGCKNETWNSHCLPVLIKYRVQLEGWNGAVGSRAGCLPLKACKLFFVVKFVCGVLSDSLLSLDDWATSQKYLLTCLALWEFHSHLLLRPQYPLHLLPGGCVIAASCSQSWM